MKNNGKSVKFIMKEHNRVTKQKITKKLSLFTGMFVDFDTFLQSNEIKNIFLIFAFLLFQLCWYLYTI